jgi:putative amino-acid transport system substrate-binding protein
MKKIKRLCLAALAIAVMAASFTGCGSQNSGNSSSEPEETGRRVVTIATGGDYYPYTFMEDEELVGFDIDLWNEIAKRCDFDIKWEIADMTGMFGMLDAGKVDFGARQITVTNVRKEKYDFTDVYAYNPYRLVVAESCNDIETLEDLYGKKIAYNPVSASGEFLDREDPENKIERVSLQGGNTFQEIELGRIDASCANATIFEAQREKGGYKVKQVGDVLYYEQNAYPCLKNTGKEELLKEINAAMAEIREEGILEEISMKWVGQDVTVEHPIEK